MEYPQPQHEVVKEFETEISAVVAKFQPRIAHLNDEEKKNALNAVIEQEEKIACLIKQTFRGEAYSDPSLLGKY